MVKKKKKRRKKEISEIYSIKRKFRLDPNKSITELTGMRGDSRSRLRELIRIRDKRTCQACGKKWKTGERRLDIHHLKGKLPSNLANVNCGVRSYFPGYVNGGYFTLSSDSNNELLYRCIGMEPPNKFKCGILTEAGEVSFKFHHTGLQGLPFAKALQMTECRKATPIKYASISPNAINYNADDMKMIFTTASCDTGFSVTTVIIFTIFLI